MKKAEFYLLKDRVTSRELDFGVWWKDDEHYPVYRITWVEKTGEVIKVAQQTDDYEILGVIIGEENVEKRFKGWADKCGGLNSLAWIRQRLGLHGNGEKDNMGNGKCDERCLHAKGEKCECVCGGINHGKATKLNL